MCRSRTVLPSCPVVQKLLCFLSQGTFVVVPFVAVAHRSNPTVVPGLDAESMLRMEIPCWLDNAPLFVEIPGEVQAEVNETRGSHHELLFVHLNLASGVLRNTKWLKAKRRG